MNERAGRISVRSINEAFARPVSRGAGSEAGPHCLRHSYGMNLTKFGHPARFVQEQVGHSHVATTSILSAVERVPYTMLEAVLRERPGSDWKAEALSRRWATGGGCGGSDGGQIMFHTSYLSPPAS